MFPLVSEGAAMGSKESVLGDDRGRLFIRSTDDLLTVLSHDTRACSAPCSKPIGSPAFTLEICGREGRERPGTRKPSPRIKLRALTIGWAEEPLGFFKNRPRRKNHAKDETKAE